MVKRTIGYPAGKMIRAVVIFLIVGPIQKIKKGRPASPLSKAIGRYVVNILLAVDQFFNVLFGGDPDETISSRLGKMERSNERFYFTRLVIDFLDGIDPGHAKKSIEDDEGGLAIF